MNVKKRKEVWVFQTAEPMPTDEVQMRAMRSINLSEKLIAEGFNVTIWTSNFNHYTKKNRFTNTTYHQINDSLRIVFIGSIGYKNNVSFRRILDHWILAINLKRKIGKLNEPDFGFVGYPPIEFAYVATNWLYRKKVPFYVDIKDLWPDSWLRSFPKIIKPVLRVLFRIYLFNFRKLFWRATGLSASSEKFLDWALANAKRTKSELDIVVPLTSRELDLSRSRINSARKTLDSFGITRKRHFRIYFAGSLSHIWDFQTVLKSISGTTIEFVVAGKGIQEKYLRKQHMLGAIKYIGCVSDDAIRQLARYSDLAIMPIKDFEDFNNNIPNKFFDAMRDGKAILTSIKGITGKLVKDEKIGILYENGNVQDLKNKLNYLLGNKSHVSDLGINSRNVYIKKFTYDKVYLELVNRINNQIKES